ncbi:MULTISPECIES: DsbA family protein [unclassified Actinotalea]|uniref:DsbA family oxidoreductase n=1 Tax=unclassified Actinotalea TaxID=2638618 RepID=UPI0015F56F2A|nr:MULTISPECIES: DsbA family oxidoreductase [unclassified Actinotalea]
MTDATGAPGATGAPDVLAVDVWSDVACPWCYLGTRRFAEGVRRFAGARAAEGRAVPEVRLTHHSFELSPDTPVDFDGTAADFLARHKGVPMAQAVQMQAQVAELAADAGLTMDFARVRHTKTLTAHELIHLAHAHGRQAEMVERLFRAYFTEGRHVGRTEDLADLAADVGLDRDEVVAALEAGTYADAVAADVAQARVYGITGVPFFVLDGRYGVSGAQDPAVFAAGLEQAASDSTSGADD